MARNRKLGSSRGPIVTPLEEHVPVNIKVVGRPEWFRDRFTEDAVLPHEKIVVYDRKDLLPVFAALIEMKFRGVDTETTGPYKSGDKYFSMNPINEGTEIVLLQIGNEDITFLVDPALLDEFKPLLESLDHVHILHNALYDFKWLLVKKGIHMARMFCSMLAEQLLTSGLMGMKVSLEDTVRRYDPYRLINKAVRSLFIHFTGRMNRKMVYYAGRDIPLLFPVYRGQRERLQRLQMITVAQDEFEAVPCTAEMEGVFRPGERVGGVDLDTTVIQQIIDYTVDREQETGNRILQIFDSKMKEKGNATEMLFADMGHSFDLGSNAAKLRALHDIDIDLDDIKRDTLKEMAHSGDLDDDTRELLLLMGEYSNIQKMLTTYGQNMLDKINPYTHKWHPVFHQLGSGEMEGRKSGGKDTIATGRMTSDAQQFPKPAEKFALVKKPAEQYLVMDHFAAELAKLGVQQEVYA
jgi:hypothetical protein